MSNTDFDYEEYRNNLEQAMKLRDGFMRFRDTLVFFILYALCYSTFMGRMIENGVCSFISLLCVFIATKVIMYGIDELILSWNIHKKNCKYTKKIVNMEEKQ